MEKKGNWHEAEVARRLASPPAAGSRLPPELNPYAAQMLMIFSTLAAQMKSFSESPPTDWVLYRTLHML